MTERPISPLSLGLKCLLPGDRQGMEAVDEAVVFEATRVEVVDSAQGGDAAEAGEIEDLEFHAGKGLTDAAVAADPERLA